MELSEADTRAKLIDPVLHSIGWTEDHIHREETARGIDIIEGKPKRRARGRIDYLLRIRVNISTQPIAVALLEAKKNTEPPDKGLEQAKRYARLNNVPFVYSSNGYLFVGRIRLFHRQNLCLFHIQEERQQGAIIRMLPSGQCLRR